MFQESFKLKFSVAICVYKNDMPENFNIAVKSVIEQTCKPAQIVIVVDGPIPENLNIIVKKYEKEDCFVVIRLKENVGHGRARQVALEKCDYNLVALMDADDISLPTRFEKQLKIFYKFQDVDIVGTWIDEFVGDTGNIIGTRYVPETDFEIKKYLKKRCPFNQMTVMFKKSSVTKSGGYLDYYLNEDYYLWIRMYQNNCKFFNIQESTVLVRVGEDMYRRRGGTKYFLSELGIQRYMKKYKIINFFEYSFNVFLRFFLQVLFPNKLRGYIFKKFTRKNYKNTL